MTFHAVVSADPVYIYFGAGVSQSFATGEVFDADPTLPSMRENLIADPPTIVAFSVIGAGTGAVDLDGGGLVPVAQLPDADALDAEVTAAVATHAALAVLDADYNAQTIMLAITDNTPVATTVGANTIVGRLAGDVEALSAADARAVLSVEDNADVTDAANVQTSGAPIWQKYTVAESAFTAASTTEDIELFSLPAAAVIHSVRIKHSASFTGNSISAFTLSVGIVGVLAKYSAAFNVFQAPGATVSLETATIGAESQSGATSIRLAAIATNDDVLDATAGSVDVWVQVSQTA